MAQKKSQRDNKQTKNRTYKRVSLCAFELEAVNKELEICVQERTAG
jgi:hypothetical protein